MHGIKLTPRLPRGVSRIPHLVQADEVCYANHHNNHYQRPESGAKEMGSVTNGNRYLTFSRDQATSHFKSLKEEFGGQKGRNIGEREVEQRPDRGDEANFPTSHILTNNESKPAERLRPELADVDRADHSGLSSSPVSAPSLRQNQQPICEAFIMTGQSMLKLSSNESEKNNNSINQKTAISYREQQHHDSRSKSLSLNKLNNVLKGGNQSNSSEEIVSPRNPVRLPASQLDKPEAGKEVQVREEIIPISKAPKPVADRFAAVVLLQNGHRNCRSNEDEELGSKSNNTKPTLDMNRTNTNHVLTEVTTTATSNSSPELLGQQDQSTGNSPSSPQAIRNDRDSAKRLAKRLYNLSGFKRSDVCHHLSKNNPFSQMVAEEYLILFDFRTMKVDSALRKFLSKLQLNGETQEREKMLNQFSQRYFDCNKDKFPNAATVQTLVCALILLNTDLNGSHGKKKRSKLSLGAFIDGLNSSIEAWSAGLEADQAVAASSRTAPAHEQSGLIQPCIGYTFPRHLLVDLYESIKKRPLKCADDKCDMSYFEAELDKIYNQQMGSRSNTLPTRRFAPGSNAPSSTLSASSRRHLKQGLGRFYSGRDECEATIEFKSGYLNRKRVFEARGVPTTRGRRAWRRVHACLQDLRLILRPGIYDESKQECKDKQLTAKQQAKFRAQKLAQDMKNTVKIHHTFAKRSTSYTKRECVFHLRLADQSEYLVQANSEQDLNVWIDTINFASACLSSPALPSAISNTKRQQSRAQRPILPVSYTKLSYWEQLIDHEERLQRLKVELDEHLSEAPQTKKANKRYQTEFIEKIAFLKQDIERYTVYVDLMRKRSNSPEAIILSKHPQIASLTPSEEMVLSLPSFAPPISADISQETAKATQQASK